MYLSVLRDQKVWEILFLRRWRREFPLLELRWGAFRIFLRIERPVLRSVLTMSAISPRRSACYFPMMIFGGASSREPSVLSQRAMIGDASRKNLAACLILNWKKHQRPQWSLRPASFRPISAGPRPPPPLFCVQDFPAPFFFLF